MEDFTEKLIEHVKKYNVLYDMSHADYKNIRIKNKVWDEIAKDMGKHNGGDLKKRWENLKDCFSKYLRSEKTRTGQAAKSIFFKPFLQFAQTQSNITGDLAESPKVVDERIKTWNIQNDATESSENVSEASSTEQEKSTKMLYNLNSYKKRKALGNSASSNSPNVDKIIKFLDKRHSNLKNNCDSIDLIFQGYAASVKKLSNRRQTIIKYKIAKITMEEELVQEAETPTETRPDTNFAKNFDASSYMSNNMSKSPYDNSSSNPSNIREADHNSSAATWYEDFCFTSI
ncbi:hypothetical protein ABEB36_013680 [Hypothenemus hampei]|uniref:MADF domain-containing protein n=1 Tax=Hypothenemus hampei TaxID=57062 RepID=A0ABD1E5V4_HYPHA